MAQVACMDQKVRRMLQRGDLVDRFLQGRGDVSIRRFAQADVAIADLNEAETGASASAHLMAGHLAESFRRKNASAHRPNHPCAGPGHALQESAAVYSVFV